MPFCDIGEHDSDAVFKCTFCGMDFCSEHGDQEAELCQNCRNEKSKEESEGVEDIRDEPE